MAPLKQEIEISAFRGRVFGTMYSFFVSGFQMA
jgi:hypothetical protein